MNSKITDSADSLALASAVLGISPDKIADQFLADTFCGQLEADGTAFLAELAEMHPHKTREAAQTVIERLEAQVINEPHWPFSAPGECRSRRGGWRLLDSR